MGTNGSQTGTVFRQSDADAVAVAVADVVAVAGTGNRSGNGERIITSRRCP